MQLFVNIERLIHQPYYFQGKFINWKEQISEFNICEHNELCENLLKQEKIQEIKEINFAQNLLTSTILLEYLRFFEVCKNLVSLDLSENLIADDCFIELCEILKLAKNLKNFNISNNKITEKSAEVIKNVFFNTKKYFL